MAQVEMLRNNLPAERPVAVTQKFLVVTCNYPARAAGVGKLMATQEALRRCPELQLVAGEDLTPYREASDQVLEVLSQFGPTQRAGLDEFFIDATAAARAEPAAAWAAGTHVHRASLRTTTAEALSGTGTSFRPMDLRAVAGGVGDGEGAATDEPLSALLRAASAVAASARAAVYCATGLTSSCGIGHNRLTAKLVASLHKPDAQTALPPVEARAFVGQLPLRALPGIGAKAARALCALGLTTVAEARAVLVPERGASAGAVRRATVVSALGGEATARLAAQCEGQCFEPVRRQKPPQSLTVEDSFKRATTHEVLVLVLRVLAPDLQRRLAAELAARGRRAASLTLRWRHHGTRTAHNPHGRASALAPTGPLVISRSVPMPPRAECESGGAAAILGAAESLLKSQLEPPFHLTLLALSASRFGGGGRAGAGSSSSGLGVHRAGSQSSGLGFDVCGASGADAARHCAFRSDYGAAVEGRSPLQLMSKQEERAAREAVARAVQGGSAGQSARGGGGVVEEEEEEEEEGGWAGAGSREEDGWEEEDGWGVEDLAAYLRGSVLEQPCAHSALRDSEETQTRARAEAPVAALPCSPLPWQADGTSPPQWACQACTFDNAPEMRECEMCATPRSGEPAAKRIKPDAAAAGAGAAAAPPRVTQQQASMRSFLAAPATKHSGERSPGGGGGGRRTGYGTPSA